MENKPKKNSYHGWKQKQGAYGEGLAKRYLQTKGYRILFQRYRTRWGEIDLIVRKKNLLSFVEVKARHGLHFGHPLAAITRTKLKHLQRAAQGFLQRHPEFQKGHDYCFMAVAIHLSESPPRIELVPLPLAQININ